MWQSSLQSPGEAHGLRPHHLRPEKDGTEFPADISLSPLEAEGELLVTAAIRDITERKRAEELIERNYHIQRAITAVLKISLEAIPLEEQMEQVLDLIVTIPGLALESKGTIYLLEDEPDVLVLKARARGLTGDALRKDRLWQMPLRPRCGTVRDRLHRLCRR